jgi:integrase
LNRSLSLIRYARIDGKGWRRGPVVLTKNGKIKHPCLIYGGVEIEAPNGRYQMVRYGEDKAVYTDLGDNPTDALVKYKAEEAKNKVRVAAVAAGITVTENATKKSLKRYAADYLEMHRNLPHRSDDSLRVYTMVTESFIEQAKAVYPEQVTQEDVIRWYGWMQDEAKLCDRTRADRYLALRGFLRYCQLDPKQIVNRGIHQLLQKYTKKLPNQYTPEQVKKLIAASTSIDRALLWDFLYKTGVRDSEAQHITRHDLHGLDTDSPTLHIKERDYLGRIKDAEERVIELHPTLVEPVKRWLKQNPDKQLLFGTINDKPDTKMLLALKATARRAGLNCGRCAGCLSKRKECKDYTLHRFRRTYVSRMLVATHGDLRSVMLRSGHSDLTSVMRYLAPTGGIGKAIVNAF